MVLCIYGFPTNVSALQVSILCTIRFFFLCKLLDIVKLSYKAPIFSTVMLLICFKILVRFLVFFFFFLAASFC